MKKTDRILNIEYALVQGFFWMGFCVCVSYATVFLQGRGFSNFSLGLVLALGNVLGFLLSPALASAVDKGGRLTVFRCLWMLLAAEILLLLSFTVIRGSLALSALYCLYIAATTAVNPLNTELSFELGGWTGRINYSAARGIGSLAYAPTAIALGSLTERCGTELLPYAGLACLALQCVMLAVISLQRKSGFIQCGVKAPGERAETLSTLRFIRANPHFGLLLLGTALLFFSHNLSNNFLINVVRNVDGDTAVMGRLSGFMALVEIPAMFLYGTISRRIRCPSLLRFSVLMFTVKALAIALSPTVGWLFAAHTLQALSFAVLTPATVQYTSLVVDPANSAKGQALSYGMTTVGSALAGGLGGLLYDSMSVSATLLVGVAVSAVGAVLCELGIVGKRSEI